MDERLLDMLRAEPYYSLPLPKTTGRELFGTQYAERIFAWGREHSLSWEDLAATATELTAWSIADAYERYVLPKYKAAELLVGGGGSYNKTLMSRLAARFERFGVEVKTQEDLGYSSDAKEARRPLPYSATAALRVCRTPCRASPGRRIPRSWARYRFRLCERHGGADVEGGPISQVHGLYAARAEKGLDIRPVGVRVEPPGEGQGALRYSEGRAADEAGVEACKLNISGPYPVHVNSVPGCGLCYARV